MNYSNAPEGRFIGGCYQCKSPMWLPQALYAAAQHSDKITFYCPYGHEQVFRAGETEETKLRRERDRLVQEQARLNGEIIRLNGALVSERKLSEVMKGKAIRARKRAERGLCPHPDCHRSFASSQMMRHIRTKHPDYKAEEVA